MDAFVFRSMWTWIWTLYWAECILDLLLMCNSSTWTVPFRLNYQTTTKRRSIIRTHVACVCRPFRGFWTFASLSFISNVLTCGLMKSWLLIGAAGMNPVREQHWKAGRREGGNREYIEGGLSKDGWRDIISLFNFILLLMQHCTHKVHNGAVQHTHNSMCVKSCCTVELLKI